MKTNTMNNDVWLLLDSSKPGGIETHVLQLAEGLKRHGELVTVVFLNYYGEHPLHDALTNRNIRTISLDGRITTLFRTMRTNNPQIVHTHGYKAGIFGRLVSKICGIPCMTTYHAGEISGGKVAVYDWIDRKTAVLANQVNAVSTQIAKKLPVPAQINDNFVDTTEVKLSNGDQIAFVGRLSIEKGPDYFLQLSHRFPETFFHFYGDGPLTPDLESSAPENLHFHGQQNEMETVWPKIGLLIMPSRHEGLPMAALEAMARGIPVLASNVGALDQLIEPNTNGWLTTAGDIDQFAHHLDQWLGMSGHQKNRIKLAARQKVQHRFSAQIAIPKLVETYAQIAR
jgi:hypothetical protein